MKWYIMIQLQSIRQVEKTKRTHWLAFDLLACENYQDPRDPMGMPNIATFSTGIE
jgi:hypothetical protein